MFSFTPAHDPTSKKEPMRALLIVMIFMVPTFESVAWLGQCATTLRAAIPALIAVMFAAG